MKNPALIAECGIIEARTELLSRSAVDSKWSGNLEGISHRNGSHSPRTAVLVNLPCHLASPHGAFCGLVGGFIFVWALTFACQCGIITSEQTSKMKGAEEMGEEKKVLPIGIENFKELVKGNYLFTDKSLLIKALLDNASKVSLFTRPRRFGKTLNMSMLRYFFEASDEDTAALFQGLKIEEAGEKYLAHMGQYPVINISLKSMEAKTYEEAIRKFKTIISREFQRHKRLLKDSDMFDADREEYFNICNRRDADYENSLKFLTDRLFETYSKQTIVLIDEYDVPLQAAKNNGYYSEMVSFIRALFENVLKTNDSLAFGVLTGCLRVSKESIFTGLNNLDVYSVTVNSCSEYFGFTESEVKDILQYYGLEERFPEIREWYDGYLFGTTEIYNPWSVVSYVKDAVVNSDPIPKPYWSHTSSNSIVKAIIEQSDFRMREEIERLMDGESIRKPLFEALTYSEIEVNSQSIWSFLLHTGYLKAIDKSFDPDTGEITLQLVVPNKEIRSIYRNTIRHWFDARVHSAGTVPLFNAVISGDVNQFEYEVRRWLKLSISYHDTKENFYHGFLAGLMIGYDGYQVESNREEGDGRSDIQIFEPLSRDVAVIIEVKPAESEEALDQMADIALKQIDKNRYAERFVLRGYKKIIKYGAAFCGKECRIKMI